MESIQNAYQGFAKQNYTMLDNLKLGYGGTKEEMQRLLDDATKISGIKYDLSSYADVVDAIHVVQNEMGITGTTAKEASTTIQGSISSMKAAWQNLLTGLTDEGQDFDTLINNLFDSIVTVGDNLIPRISVVLDGIANLISTLAPKLVEKIPELLNTLLPAAVSGAVALVNAVVLALPGTISALMSALPTLITGVQSLISGLLAVLPDILITVVDTVILIIPILVQSLIDCLPQLLDCVLQLAMGLCQGILDAIPMIVSMLPNIINSVIEFLIGAIPQIISTGIQLFTSLISALPEITTSVCNAIPIIVNNLVSSIISLIPLLIQAGCDLLVSLIQNLPTIIQTILTSIPQIISSLCNAISSNIPLIIQAGCDLLVSLVKNLPSIIIEVVKAIPLILKSLISALAEGLPQMASAGLNLIKGLFNGISDAVSWLYGKLKSWVSGVLDFIKGLFGIHSPSKETAWMGDMLVQGLANGVDDNEDKALDAAEKLSTDVLDTMSDLSDDVTDIENGMFENKEISYKVNGENGVSLSAPKAVKSNVSITGNTIISGLNSLFDKYSRKNAEFFDNLINKMSVGSSYGVSTTNKAITINMGDIAVSGVLDKDAAEQVKDIAEGQVQEFSNELADVYNNY